MWASCANGIDAFSLVNAILKCQNIFIFKCISILVFEILILK